MEQFKKAILYCRVSSDEQAKGCSLDHQEKELKDWCIKNEVDVVKIFREDHSAKTTNRPELQKALSEFNRQNSGVNYFLVLRWNRLSRNADDGNSLIKKMRKNGIEVNAIEEWIDHKVAEAKILLSIYLAMAEVDNDKRAKATCDGIHATLLKGKCANKAPRGYVNKRKDDYTKWVDIDPKVGPLVKEAFEEVAKGIKSPTLVWREMKAKGLKCGRQSFFDMLRNHFYIGEVFVPAYNNDPDQYVKGLHKPLVEPDVFYKVQDVLKPSTKRKRDKESIREHYVKINKMPQPEFYMRDFLVCPHCGSKLRASFSKGRHARYPYYHCNHCHKFRIKADAFNSGFEASLNGLTPPDNLIRLFQEICDDVIGESSKTREQRIAKLRSDISDKEDNLMKLQDMLMEDRVSPENFSIMTERYNKEIMIMKSELNELTYQPSDKSIGDKLNVASNILKRLGDLLSQLPVNEKIELLGSTLSEKIVLDDEKSRTVYLKPALALIAGISSDCKDKKETDCEFSFTARHSTQSRGRTGTGCPTGV